VPTPADYLDLYDYRRQVIEMYRRRDDADSRGEEPVDTWRRFCRERDALFATHPQSALTPEDRERFAGLRWYPYDPSLRVPARLTTDLEPRRYDTETSGPEAMPLALAGQLELEIGGRSASLALFWIDVYGGGLFLPFRDGSAPDETYGGGRYLFDTVKGSGFRWIEEGRTLVLDFNYAYNPSCAYDPRWVCPLAPPENRMPFPIRAGEMRYEPPAR
jgi:uncharacterized protein (DUF1684 family)